MDISRIADVDALNLQSLYTVFFDRYGYCAIANLNYSVSSPAGSARATAVCQAIRLRLYQLGVINSSCQSLRVLFLNVSFSLYLRLQAHLHRAKLFQPTSALMLSNEKAAFIGDVLCQGASKSEEKASHLARCRWARGIHQPPCFWRSRGFYNITTS
jgi:hypothetical protein